MDRDVILSALFVLFVAVILLMCLLYAHSMWRRWRLAEDSRIMFAEDDQQQQQMNAAQRKGLDKAVIEALPIFIYMSDAEYESLGNLQRSVADKGEACRKLHNTECPICLSEFQHKERGRELPKCKHRFHVDCIDKWLYANGTCPVCRASCAGGDSEEGPQEINDRTSISINMGIQFPTNVLFWGSNSLVSSRVIIGGLEQVPASSSVLQIYTRELPLDAAASSSSSSFTSSRISTLNPLRRLLSREMRLHSSVQIDPPIGAHSCDSPSTHISISKA